MTWLQHSLIFRSSRMRKKEKHLSFHLSQSTSLIFPLGLGQEDRWRTRLAELFRGFNYAGHSDISQYYQLSLTVVKCSSLRLKWHRSRSTSRAPQRLLDKFVLICFIASFSCCVCSDSSIVVLWFVCSTHFCG